MNDDAAIISELKSIFPQFDTEIIEAVLASSNRNRDSAVNALLSMVSDQPPQVQI